MDENEKDAQRTEMIKKAVARLQEEFGTILILCASDDGKRFGWTGGYAGCCKQLAVEYAEEVDFNRQQWFDNIDKRVDPDEDDDALPTGVES